MAAPAIARGNELSAPLVCPVDGVVLDGAGDCRRCGAGWRREVDVAARGATAFRRLAPDESGAEGPSRTLACPACRATLAPWRLDTLDVWLYRCPSCQGWLCPRGTLSTLARVDAQLRRQIAFESFSPEERAAMAREIAAEAAASAPDPELPPVHAFLALLGLPVVTRIRRERLPLVTWGLALALIAVFVTEVRGAGVEEAVARLAYGPANRGLWAALKATFAHAGVAQLIGNVYFLLAFGDGVEQRAPRWLLALAFAILGVGVLLIDAALHPASVLTGASGGVAAVIGACIVLQPRAQVAIKLWPLSFRLSMRGFFFAALALQALLGVLHVAGVEWTAHLLGLAFGAAGAALLRWRLGRPSVRAHS
jgi:membrane associated rhomboid family serine protease/Zn-finger nucleic acid-binding protein